MAINTCLANLRSTVATSSARSMAITSSSKRAISRRAWLSTSRAHSLRSCWLHLIPGFAPSDPKFHLGAVVTTALRQCLPQFLLSSSDCDTLAKFIFEKQDKNQMEFFWLTGRARNAGNYPHLRPNQSGTAIAIPTAEATHS